VPWYRVFYRNGWLIKSVCYFSQVTAHSSVENIRPAVVSLNVTLSPRQLHGQLGPVWLSGVLKAANEVSILIIDSCVVMVWWEGFRHAAVSLTRDSSGGCDTPSHFNIWHRMHRARVSTPTCPPPLHTCSISCGAIGSWCCRAWEYSIMFGYCWPLTELIPHSPLLLEMQSNISVDRYLLIWTN